MSKNIKLHTIETVNFKADGGTMFGCVPKSMWQKVYPSDDSNLCPCSVRSLLIETGDRKILIDTGIGDKLDPEYAKHFYLFGEDTLLSSLTKVGCKPEDITDVILTHLHYDHCGGLTAYNESGESEILFKNATIWVGKEQWDWAITPNRREKAAYLKENLDPIAKSDKVKFVAENTEIIPGIELRLFYGHTHGLMSVFINMGQRRLVFAGDLLPAVPYVKLSFNAAYDIMPLLTIQEKQNLLNEMVENDDVLFLQHDYYTEVCTLINTAKGIRENVKAKLNEIF